MNLKTCYIVDTPLKNLLEISLNALKNELYLLITQDSIECFAYSQKHGFAKRCIQILDILQKNNVMLTVHYKFISYENILKADPEYCFVYDKSKKKKYVNFQNSVIVNIADNKHFTET